MYLLDPIFSLVWDISDWFYEAYRIVDDWTGGFWHLADPLYYISSAFWNMLAPISAVNDWIYNVTQEIASIVDIDDIWFTFKQWFDWAEWAWEWISDAWYYVTDIVGSWWSATSLTVLAWIDQVRDYADQLVAGVMEVVDNLQAAWDTLAGWIPTIEEIITWWGSWTGQVLSVVNTWWTGALLEVQDLINTGFFTRADLWAGWTDLRDQVVEFFTDPLEVLWTKFADWFLGPEV